VTVTTFKEKTKAIGPSPMTRSMARGGCGHQTFRAPSRGEANHNRMVWINCYKRANPGSPFGGVRSSGYGRDLGIGIEGNYTSPKFGTWVTVTRSSAVLPALTLLRWH